MWPKNFDIDMFFLVLNNLTPAIVFTIEQEHNSSLSVLDTFVNINFNSFNCFWFPKINSHRLTSSLYLLAATAYKKMQS